MHTSYREKHLSQFPIQATLDGLLASPIDSVLFSDYACHNHSGYLHNQEYRAFIVSLDNSYLCPRNIYVQNSGKWPSINDRSPARHFRSFVPSRSLIASQERYIFSGSFCGPGDVNSAPRSFTFEDGAWHAYEPEVTQILEGNYLHLGILSAHFGHFLVDSLAMMWPLVVFGSQIENLLSGYLAFDSHGLNRSDSKRWPGWMHDMLSALGINTQKIILIGQPTTVARCLVPRKIAPWNGVEGDLYNKTAQHIGTKLLEVSRKIPSTSKLLFLSRSKLKEANRSIDSDLAYEVDHLFTSKGFDVFHPQEHSIAEQVRMIRGADCIAGVTGSQMHLAAFSTAKNLKLFRIVPSVFQTSVDANILKGISVCAEVTDYVIDSSIRPNELKHKASLPSSICLKDLSDKIDKWLAK